MILYHAKFLTNHNLEGTYTINFKANIYELIHIKTMVTLSGRGEGRKKSTETHNDLAQELGNQNTDRKTSLKFNKELKKIFKKKTVIDTKKPKNSPRKESTEIEINEVLDNLITNTKGLFKYAVSTIKLKEAWNQLKSDSDILTKKSENKIINNVNESWFENTSQTLLNGTFKYPMIKKVNIPKIMGKTVVKPLNIINPKIRVIEKTLLNHLEIIFEGAYQ